MTIISEIVTCVPYITNQSISYVYYNYATHISYRDPRPAASCDPARESPAGRVSPRGGSHDLPGAAAGAGGVLRPVHARILPDDGSRASPVRAGAGIVAGAGDRRHASALHAAAQRARALAGASVAEPLLLLPHGRGLLLARAALHRAQPATRRHGRHAGGVPLVERRCAPRPATDAAVARSDRLGKNLDAGHLAGIPARRRRGRGSPPPPRHHHPRPPARFRRLPGPPGSADRRELSL